MAQENPAGPIEGSARKNVKRSRSVGRPDSGEIAEVTLYLRRRSPVTEQSMSSTSGSRMHMTREELARSHGAHDKALEQVRAFAEKHSLRVVEESAGKRRVRVEGTIEALSNAFGVELVLLELPEGTYRSHEGEVHLPTELLEHVIGVLGLDNRPMARRSSVSAVSSAIDPNSPPEGCMSALEVAEAYEFPEHLDGAGQCVGIIELGGGFYHDEIEVYFEQYGLSVPEIDTVGPNSPGSRSNPNGLNEEVALDIEVAGSVAPKARYVFYFGQCTDNGFINILQEAIHDSDRSPSILSVSWSMAETEWSESAARVMQSTLEDAAKLGITVCVSSGDYGSYGSSEGIEDGSITPVIPASVPYALACGGTRMTVDDGSYESEVVWNQLDTSKKGASGGGVSSYFELPEYQTGAGVPAVPEGGAKEGFHGRGVPDVAGHADPRVGYLMYCNGEWSIHGATSAVAPLWAGLFALLNQGVGERLGFANASLYGLLGSDVFHEIASGDNGYYEAGSGWNACTGLGTPIGSKLLVALKEKDSPGR